MTKADRRRARAALLLRDGKLCCWCHEPLMLSNYPGAQWHPKYATIEHIIPRSEGGCDDPSNLALAHRLCNQGRVMVRSVAA